MNIRLNKNKEGEIIFSWREIFILIKKRKLILDKNFLDKIIHALVICRIQLNDIEKKDKKNVE